jgi:hypothetical protein
MYDPRLESAPAENSSLHTFPTRSDSINTDKSRSRSRVNLIGLVETKSNEGTQPAT